MSGACPHLTQNPRRGTVGTGVDVSVNTGVWTHPRHNAAASLEMGIKAWMAFAVRAASPGIQSLIATCHQSASSTGGTAGTASTIIDLDTQARAAINVALGAAIIVCAFLLQPAPK